MLTQQMLSIIHSQLSGLMGKPEERLPSPEPKIMLELQKELMESHTRLWNSLLKRESGEASEPVIKSSQGDRRFSGAGWQHAYFDFLRQSYLLNAKYMREVVANIPFKDQKTRERAHFMTEQIINAASPANYAATNPEFINTALETQGRSITEGIGNLIVDIQNGRISTTDETAFEVGKNLATTAGAVIYENDFFQLLQYEATTPKVAKRPLLMVPPCINKFYILDLQPENSFVRYAVDQGNTVFLMSWRNVQPDLGHLTWDDYIGEAILPAIEIVREITKSDEINLLGFCVGGTMLSSALAVLAARGKYPAASLTLLTTFLDFSEPGELGLFIDEESIAAREATIGNGGLLNGSELETTFSALRPNDLIWNYVANNYLKGKRPSAFDLLYWNSDSTNLPGPFAVWYMKNMYQENNLRIPGKLTVCGEKVDLGSLKMPAFLLATREDHIVPWHSAYLSTGLLGGETFFTLGASGHVAGVINPANKNRRSYWTGGKTGGSAEDWFKSAKENPGSWWICWSEWLKNYADGEKNAPTQLGNTKYKVIEPAPGRYVKAKSRPKT